MQNDVSSQNETRVDDERRTITIPLLPASVLQTPITMDDPRWSAFMPTEQEKQTWLYAALDGRDLSGQGGPAE